MSRDNPEQPSTELLLLTHEHLYAPTHPAEEQGYYNIILLEDCKKIRESLEVTKSTLSATELT